MKSLLFLNIIIEIIITGEAILCYQSESMYAAFDIRRPRTLDCPDFATCGKRILHWSDGMISVTRGCTMPLHLEDVVRSHKHNASATIMNIFYCNTDLCNDAQLITSGYVIIFPILIAIL